MSRLKLLLHSVVTWIKQNKLETAFLVFLLILSLFLRLYKIRDFIIFLGDEGRDALVVKRMLVDHKLTLLGPTASVGGFYLGPVYYYMMLPFMFLWGLDPVGPAIMVALMGVATVFLLYAVTRDWFDRQSAALAALAYAVSPGVVEFSRSSWNPNPLPLFSLISISSLHYGLIRQSTLLIFISAISFGITVQLHYLALLLAPIMATIALVHAKPSRWPKIFITAVAGFLTGASMFFAFEIRHGFLNIKSIFEFVSRTGDTTGIRNANIFWLVGEINRFNIESVLGPNLTSVTSIVSTVFFTISFFLIAFQIFKHKKISPQLKTILIYITIGTIGVALYRGNLYPHYFEWFFTAPYLLLAATIHLSKQFKPLNILITLALIVSSATLILFQPIQGKGSKLVDQTSNIASSAAKMTGGQEFNFALIAQGNSDHAYRFFFEKDHHRPLTLEEMVTEQLIIICELPEDECRPHGHPLWEIAGFGRAEIVEKTVEFPGVSIFKLIHHQDSIESVGKPVQKG